MSSQHVVPVRVNVSIFAILMALLGLTIGAAYVDLGRLNFPVSMTIAGVKAVLIALFFMHVKYSHRLIWIFSGASLLWLGILLFLSMNDFLSREMLKIPGK